MATWIAHMRIAEYFMKNNASLNNTLFLVGNIGPDCGVPNDDWSQFTPDTNITHWKTGDNKSTINAESFKQSYLQFHNENYPFYLGYYFHLLTDIEWSKLYERKKQDPLYANGLNADEKFIWTIKQDWYGQDHIYLREHKESVFYTVFSKIDEFPNAYLDFYPDDAFIQQVKYITNFYLKSNENPDRDFPYLSKHEMNEFVENTINILKNIEIENCRIRMQLS